MKNDILIPMASLFVFAANAPLVNNAYAKQSVIQVQKSLETNSALQSSADPKGSLNLWKTQTQNASIQSKTTAVKANGLSALDSLKQQTSQFSRQLRSSSGVSEGRFEAPGLYEFSMFMNLNENSTTDDTTRLEEIDKLRIATIQSIEKLLRQQQTGNQKVDLLLRLSELHAERYNDFLIREMTQYETAYDKWVNNLRTGPEPKFNQEKSIRSINAATQILRNLVSQYPSHSKTPDALYQLGFLLTEMKSDSATLYFQRLIDRFPKSNYIPDAYLALGEYYFSKNRFNDAQLFYQKVLNHRNHRGYPYAVYKLGWTFFNLRGNEEETTKNLQKSLIAFQLLVKFAQESGPAKKLSLLRKDALRDMVLVYADIGNIDDAQKYFKSINETSLYQTLLERLAWIHSDAGRYQTAIDVYQRLLTEFPKNSKNPNFLVRLAGLYEKEQKRNLLITQLEQLSELLAQDSPWWEAQKNAQDQKAAVSLLLNESQFWGLKLHAEFQKTKNKTTAQQALNIYDTYLKHSDESAKTYLIQFNRAQLLTTLEEHEKAIDGYLQAVEMDRRLSLGRSESQVALENAIAESDILIQRRERNALVESKNQIPPFEQKLIRIIDLHALLFPKNTERLPLLHRAALIHFQSGLITQATQRWNSIAREAPQSTFASEGLRLLIKRSFDESNWLKAASDSRSFLSIPGVTKAPVGAHIGKLLRVALFQRGLQLEKDGKNSDAVRVFSDFQKEFPTDTDAGKALINAANNQLKINRPEDALSSLSNFLVNYPNSEFYLRALEMTAMTAESIGKFSDAAKAYESMISRKTNKEQISQDLKHAAELRLAENNSQRAINNAEGALAHLKRGEDICETYKIILDAQTLVQDKNRLFTSQTAAQKCQTLSPEWSVYFNAMAAKLNLVAGRSNEAEKHASLSLSRGKMLASKLQNPFAYEGMRIAGEVQLSLLEGQSKELLARKVDNSNSIQSEFGHIKTDAQQLAQKYIQLNQMGQAETSIGALYRIAEIQEGLANILVQSPNPQGLSPSETESFRAKIEKIAIPLQEEAAKLYAQALDRASEGEVLTPYTLLLKEKLALLRPGDFRKSIEIMPRPSYFAHELPISEESKEVVEEN